MYKLGLSYVPKFFWVSTLSTY